jgi:hypothetical protein
MPAKSKKQQMAAGAALAAKRGRKSKSSLKGASRQMVESMSETELRKMAKTKRNVFPDVHPKDSEDSEVKRLSNPTPARSGNDARAA